MKKSKIVLHRTAVRILTTDALEGVAGASIAFTCRPSCQLAGCTTLTQPITCADLPALSANC